MHSSFVLAEIHWIAGFKFFFLKATAISPHFQISSVDTTHQFRLSGIAAQNWRANNCIHFLCTRQGGITLPTVTCVHICYWKYLLLCCSPSLQLRLTPDQEPGHSLMSSYVHTANLSIAKEQRFLQLLTIKSSHNLLAECSKKPPWTQASSHNHRAMPRRDKPGRWGALPQHRSHLGGSVARIFKLLKAKIIVICVSDFPRTCIK